MWRAAWLAAAAFALVAETARAPASDLDALLDAVGRDYGFDNTTKLGAEIIATVQKHPAHLRERRAAWTTYCTLSAVCARDRGPAGDALAAHILDRAVTDQDILYDYIGTTHLRPIDVLATCRGGSIAKVVEMVVRRSRDPARCHGWRDSVRVTRALMHHGNSILLTTWNAAACGPAITPGLIVWAFATEDRLAHDLVRVAAQAGPPSTKDSALHRAAAYPMAARPVRDLTELLKTLDPAFLWKDAKKARVRARSALQFFGAGDARYVAIATGDPSGEHFGTAVDVLIHMGRGAEEDVSQKLLCAALLHLHDHRDAAARIIRAAAAAGVMLDVDTVLDSVPLWRSMANILWHSPDLLSDSAYVAEFGRAPGAAVFLEGFEEAAFQLGVLTATQKAIGGARIAGCASRHYFYYAQHPRVGTADFLVPTVCISAMPTSEHPLMDIVRHDKHIASESNASGLVATAIQYVQPQCLARLETAGLTQDQIAAAAAGARPMPAAALAEAARAEDVSPEFQAMRNANIEKISQWVREVLPQTAAALDAIECRPATAQAAVRRRAQRPPQNNNSSTGAMGRGTAVLLGLALLGALGAGGYAFSRHRRGKLALPWGRRADIETGDAGAGGGEVLGEASCEPEEHDGQYACSDADDDADSDGKSVVYPPPMDSPEAEAMEGEFLAALIDRGGDVRGEDAEHCGDVPPVADQAGSPEAGIPSEACAEEAAGAEVAAAVGGTAVDSGADLDAPAAGDDSA